MVAYSQDFLKLLQSQDEASFATLYEDTVDMFYRYIKSHYFVSEPTTQDLLSETYLKIWNNLNNIDDTKKLWPYLWTILRNTIKDHFKKTKEIAFSEMYHQEDQVPFEETLEDSEQITVLFDTQFESERIIQALNRLDDKFQQVLFLKYIELFENQEIALQLGISEENVRQRISRWLGKLRSLLQ